MAYRKVSDSFWTGRTGKQIRSLDDPQVIVLAVYLLTCRHSNRLGLYYLPVPFINHETGIPLKALERGFEALSGFNFCRFDADSEVVWVIEMARWQVLEGSNAPLKPKDNQVKSLNKVYQELPKCLYLGEFFDKYVNLFHLDSRRDPIASEALDSEGPSKPLRSRERERERESNRSSLRSDLAPSDSGESSPPVPATAPPDDPVVQTLPTNNGVVFDVTQSMAQKWSTAYPAVDVPSTLKRIDVWLDANPTRRKTPKGMKGFITRWLGKEQDRPAPGSGAGRMSVNDGPPIREFTEEDAL